MSNNKNSHRRFEQYLIEKKLRERILKSKKTERHEIIAAAYEELFISFPDHDVFHVSDKDRLRVGRLSAGLIAPLLPPQGRILEVGCGRGDTINSLSSMGFSCWGVEASQVMVKMARMQNNAVVVQGMADQLEFDDGFFDCVFSQEMIEHMHPEDLPGHFREAYRVLRSEGFFSVETPNRTTGPQDVSRSFSNIAQGLHLKEYSVAELIRMFRDNGFINVKCLLVPQALARRSRIVHLLSRVPAEVKIIQDVFLELVPFKRIKPYIGKTIGLDDIFIFAKKP